MNVKKIRFGKNTGRPKTVTVKMSLDEAAAIAKTFGTMSLNGFREKFPTLPDDTNSEIYGCLVGELFNRFWDDGVDGYIRGDEE